MKGVDTNVLVRHITNLRLGCDATVTFDRRLKGLAGFAPLPTAGP
jgi:predicted nucleic-acid-binding protein